MDKTAKHLWILSMKHSQNLMKKMDAIKKYDHLTSIQWASLSEELQYQRQFRENLSKL